MILTHVFLSSSEDAANVRDDDFILATISNLWACFKLVLLPDAFISSFGSTDTANFVSNTIMEDGAGAE